MPCPTKESLSPFIDGELSDKELAAVTAHLDLCGECRRELADLRSLGSLLKALPERPLPEGFSRRLKQRPAPDAAALAPSASSQRLALALACAGAGFVVMRASLKTPEKPPPPAARAAKAPGGPIESPEAPAPGQAPSPKPSAAAPEPALTNEELYSRLQDEAKTMGIKNLRPPQQDEDMTDAQAAQTRGQGPRTREEAERYMRQIAALRRAMGVVDNPGVTIGGKTSVLLAGNEGAPGAPLKAAAERAPKAFAEPVAGALEHGWSGPYGGGNDAGTQTVSDPETWGKLWKSLSTVPVPPVDFARYEIAAVFLGPRPSGGYRVDIKEVKATESFVLVRFQESAPPPGRAAAEGMTSPYVLRVIDKTSLPIRFEAVPQ